MGTVRYTVINGAVLSENRNATKRDYLPDPLGSTLALLDNTQTKTDTFSYWPYGEVVSRTGTTATPFQYVGTKGYYRDSSSRTYVRARTLDTRAGRWMTHDPVGFAGGDWNLYGYVKNNPERFSDFSGKAPKVDPKCKELKDVSGGLTIACNKIKSAQGQACINKLGPAYKACISKFCKSTTNIHCGSPTCANDNVFPECKTKICCTKGHADGSLNNGSCHIYICTGVIGTPRCLKTRPGVTNVQVNIATTMLHEAMHCCGMLDHSRGNKNYNNPAEDVARCIMGISGHDPGY